MSYTEACTNDSRKEFDMKEKQSSPEFSNSYYLIQIILAIAGMVIGFWTWGFFEIIGKPDYWLYLIPMGLALIFVNLHRIITIKMLKKKNR
jgi:hypothetical protein